MVAAKIKPVGEAKFRPVQSQRTFEVVCERVREKLLQGELQPGDKLPPERDLALQLGVSRNVVREALRSLEIAGVVVLRKGAKGGAFIQEGDPSRIAGAFNDLITLNAISLKDLFEARTLILEVTIDQIFKQDLRPDFSRLEQIIDATRHAARENDIARRIQCAFEFYHELAVLSHNTVLVFTVDAQTELVQTFLRYRVADMSAETLIASREMFLVFLKEEKIEAAKIELRGHLARVHRSLW